MKSKSLFLLLFLCVHFVSCNALKSPSYSNKNRNLLLMIFGLEYLISNQAMYYYVPGTAGSTPANAQFIPEGQFPANQKTKVILVHGWDVTERPSDPNTTNSQKIQNILGTWQNALEFIDSDLAASQSNFAFYCYTYRTTNHVSYNGDDLAKRISNNFSASDNVIVLAHSMGGLVTRAAVYSSNNSSQIIDYVVSLGSPYYGSPFASSAFQGNLNTLGDLITFLTNTDGGKDMAYTNTNNSPTLSGASNPYLDSLNEQTAQDYRFYPYYGVLSSCSQGTSAVYQTGCSLLESGSNGNPIFANSDSIVPANSAMMSTAGQAHSVSKSGLDHPSLSFRNTSTNTNQTFFTEVIQRMLGFTF